jgi:hypothetical protein
MVDRLSLIRRLFGANISPKGTQRILDAILDDPVNVDRVVANEKTLIRVNSSLTYNLALVPLGSIGSDHGFCEFCPVDGTRCIVCS